jgi:RNase P/RNase MRP subunit POP5
VLEWRPYQKARYITQLVEHGHKSFAEIARSIGSKVPTVRDHYVAYSLVRQARDAFNIDTSNAEDAFGVLRRALSDPGIREFVNLNLDRSERELREPIAKSKAKSLRDLFSWLFGNENETRVLTDSRALTKLGHVLTTEEGLKVLSISRDLDRAYQRSGGEEKELVELFDQATYYLDQALPLAVRHRNRKDVMRAFVRCSGTFKEIERHFPGD